MTQTSTARRNWRIRHCLRSRTTHFSFSTRAHLLAAQKKIDAAILEGEAAIKSDPNYPSTYAHLAWWKGLAGHSEQGLADAETAMRLSPRDPLKWVWQLWICDLHINLAQWDQAIAPCQQAVAANPKGAWASRLELAAAYSWLGREAEAKAELAEVLKLVPSLTVKGVVSYSHVFSDNPTHLQQVTRMAEGLRKAGLPEQ